MIGEEKEGISTSNMLRLNPQEWNLEGAERTDT